MAVDTGTIYSDVRVRIDKLKGDVLSVNKEFDKLGSGITQTSEKTEKSVSSSFGKMLASIGALAGVQAVIRNVISTFASFEQSMANVASVAGATPAELEKLTAAAREAGETTKFTASQAAEALYNLASAGLDATESMDALDGVLSLAAATGSDLATSSATVTAALSQYSLDAKEATRVSNVFAAAIANSQASMEKLGSAFRQVGPVAGALGISLEETTGALQALFDAGFRGEQAGTVLRNILSQLADVTGPASKKLAALGIDMSKIDPSANRLINVLGTLAEANLTAGEAINAFGTEAGPGLLQLLKAGREGLQDYTDAVTGTDAASRQAEIQMNTLQGDIYKLNSALEGLAIGVGEGLNPLLRFLVDMLTDIVLAVNAVPDPIKAMTLAFGAGVIAVQGLGAAIGALGVTINVALGPIGWVTGAIGALATGVAVLVGHNNDLKSQQMSEEFKDIAAAAELTGEQLLNISRQFTVFNVQGAASTEEILDLAKELGREFGKTPAQILAIAERYNGLNSDARDAIQTVLEQQEREQYIIDTAIRYERLRQDAKEALEARARAQAEEAEREAAAIADALRLEREREQARVQSVVDRREAALKRTEATVDEINRKMAAGFISQEEGAKAVTKALEAEAEELFNIGFTGQLVETTWINKAGERVTAIAAGDRRLNEILKTLQSERLNNALAANEQERRDYANTASFMTETQRAAAQVRADIATKEWEAKKAAIEEEARLRKESEQARIDAANFAVNTILTGLNTIDQVNKVHLQNRLAEIDRELQATLEAQGLAEETKIQRLEKELAEAIEAGDEETAQEKRNAIARAKIEEDFQKQKAKAEYDAAVASWTIQLLSAGAQAAQGVLNAYVSTLAIPIVGPALAPAAAIAAGIFGAAQVGIVAAQKPEAPSFQTGGIVPGRQFSGDNVQVNVNSGEMILTREQQQTLFDTIAGGLNGNGQPIVINLTSELNGRVLAEEVVKYIARGNVQIPR